MPVEIQEAVTDYPIICFAICKEYVLAARPIHRKSRDDFLVVAPVEVRDSLVKWDYFPQLGTIQIRCKHGRISALSGWQVSSCKKEEPGIILIENCVVEPHVAAPQEWMFFDQALIDLCDGDNQLAFARRKVHQKNAVVIRRRTIGIGIFYSSIADNFPEPSQSAVGQA